MGWDGAEAGAAACGAAVGRHRLGKSQDVRAPILLPACFAPWCASTQIIGANLEGSGADLASASLVCKGWRQSIAAGR